MRDHRTLTARELDVDGLSRAYPLLEVLGANAGLADWIRYLGENDRAANGGGKWRGIVAVEDSKGYLLGLFCYRLVEDALRGLTFECENFTVPDLVRSSLPFESLIDDAERLAQLYGCRHLSVSITTTEPQGALSLPMRELLDERSFAFDSVRYTKTLAPRDAASDVGPLDAP